MIGPRKDRIDAWLRAPVRKRSKDPRFEVRRVNPAEYDRLFDLVDTAFGCPRSRKEFDWLYRRNPSGSARSWVVIDRATDAFVSAETLFPWPVARGDEAIEGVILGDSVTHPGWQHMRLTRQRTRMRVAHPWIVNTVGFAGPNAKSRSQIRKYGQPEYLMGPVPAAAFVLRSREALERLGWPRALAGPAGLAADVALASWRALSLAPADARIRPVERFDSDYDPVTDRHMRWPRFWCPHDASFLNWRYLDHPTQEFVAHALVERERPIGYCVVRLGVEGATLAEFVVDPEARRDARGLLTQAIRTARDAGAPHLAFFAPDSWRHWSLFRRSGFLGYRSEDYIVARGGIHEPEVCDLANWQLVPGDRDFR